MVFELCPGIWGTRTPAGELRMSTTSVNFTEVVFSYGPVLGQFQGENHCLGS